MLVTDTQFDNEAFHETSKTNMTHYAFKLHTVSILRLHHCWFILGNGKCVLHTWNDRFGIVCCVNVTSANVLLLLSTLLVGHNCLEYSGEHALILYRNASGPAKAGQKQGSQSNRSYTNYSSMINHIKYKIAYIAICQYKNGLPILVTYPITAHKSYQLYGRPFMLWLITSWRVDNCQT
jgi:hypothetical protein